MTDIVITGIDNEALREALIRGVDHGGNPIEPFVDADGGWPLRCCLADSALGDVIATIAWSPFPWSGPYAEVGPLVVHADACHGAQPLDRLPVSLDRRSMTLRPYGLDRKIAYDRVTHVDAAGSVTSHLRELLADPDIEFVHGRNTTGGCFSFQAARV